MRKPLPFPPHAPAITDDTPSHVIYAIKALAEGIASDHQQKAALDFIINEISRYYDLSYREGGDDGDRASCFAEGKRFVGAQIIKALKIIPAKPWSGE